MNRPLSIASTLRLYRQAKIALLEERSGLPHEEIVEFEESIHDNTQRLTATLNSRRAPPDKPLILVRRHTSTQLHLRAHIQQSIPSAALDILWLRAFGPLLDSLCGSGCYSNRLKKYTNKQNHEHIHESQRHLFVPWGAAYERFHKDIRETIRATLERGQGCTLLSFDIANYYNSIDIRFLTSPEFISTLRLASTELSIPFSDTEYASQTGRLIRRYSAFQKMVAKNYSCNRNPYALPIGAVAARTIANVALFKLDQRASSQVKKLGKNSLLHYGRWVDDIVLIVDGKTGRNSSNRLRSIIPFSSKDTLDADKLLLPGSTLLLNSGKARKFEFTGDAGTELLASLSAELDAVGSYRGAFGAAISKPAQREQLLELVRGATAAGDNQFQYIETAKVRRVAALALLRKVLEAAVLDVNATSRRRNDALRTLAKILHGERDWVSFFDIVLRAMEVSIVAQDSTSEAELSTIIENKRKLIRTHAGVVRLDGSPCLKSTITEASELIDRLARKSRATAASASRSTNVSAKLIATYQRADLRVLKFEDDQHWSERPQARRKRLPPLDGELRRELAEIAKYKAATDSIGDNSYSGLEPIRIWLSERPPSLLDVSLKWAQAFPDQPVPTEHLVNAVRGTRFYDTPARIAQTPRGRQIIPSLGLEHRPYVRVVLANLKTSTAAFEAAANGTPDRSLARLAGIAEVVERARRLRRSSEHLLLVLPELSVPRHALRELAASLVKDNIGLIAGLEYSRRGSSVANEVIAVIPRRYGVVTAIWRKATPAAGDELNELKRRHLSLARPEAPPGTTVLSSQYGTIGVLICSELLELAARARLVGRVDLLLVPSWNTDTYSFEALVNASALDIHCYVGVSNNSLYSDCRIRSPAKKPHERDLCRLIERGNSVVSARVDIAALREFQEDELRKRAAPPSAARHDVVVADRGPLFKPLPPVFEFSRAPPIGR